MAFFAPFFLSLFLSLFFRFEGERRILRLPRPLLSLLRCLITDTSILLVFLSHHHHWLITIRRGGEEVARGRLSRHGHNGWPWSVGCSVGAIIVWFFYLHFPFLIPRFPCFVFVSGLNYILYSHRLDCCYGGVGGVAGAVSQSVAWQTHRAVLFMTWLDLGACLGSVLCVLFCLPGGGRGLV